MVDYLYLVRLETQIKETNLRKVLNSHINCCMFEKACDTTWKYQIMNDLAKLGLRGRLIL